MKLAYLDCASGIAGDMLLGALVDAGVDLAAIQAGIDSLGLTGVKLVREEVQRCGYRATKIDVQHEPEHAHRHLHHITDMIDRAAAITPAQKELAKRIFTRLGEAEAKVHGTTLRKVHFHEVGAVDSIADIVGGAIGLNLLGVDRIVSSPLALGSGYITIAHGRVSVPAPATAELLVNIPTCSSPVEAELTTPTGAAIVSTIADEYGFLPPMTIQSIGYGAGTKNFSEQPNLVRLIVGETSEKFLSDHIVVLETNLDDISGEVIGHCATLLAEAGALDVYTASIQMKKNRPGVLLSVLSPPALVTKLEKIIFRETSTLGIRRWPVSRHKLDRRPHTVETTWGPVLGKLAILADGTASFSPEFEACRAVATQHNLPLKDVYEAARKSYK